VSTLRLSAERVLDAPADVVYHCIRDYQDHHRPGGFLPPAFTYFNVERGGIGAGTRITFTTKAGGGSQTRTQDVSEPEPGRVLVESGGGDSTIFTVEPAGEGRARVRFDTVLTLNGLMSLIGPLVIPRVLKPIYEDELGRLEAHARAHGPLS
jgi:hypothetical protein